MEAQLNDDSADKKQPSGLNHNLRLYVIVGTFVLCGTLTTVISSVCYNMESEGRDGQVRPYAKPLFMNAAMFLGMSFCLLIGPIKKCLGMSNPPATPDGYTTLNGDPSNVISEEITWAVAKKVTLPALCDFIATQLMNVGLLWMDASIWQMLRGSIIIWTAVIRWGWLKKPLMIFQWIGVLLVVIALSVIGSSAVLGSSSEANHTEQQQALGICLVMLGMFVQAIQTVAEEHLLTPVEGEGKSVKTAPFIVVGIEGLWGLSLSLIIMPIVAAFPPTWEGVHEDTIDTFVMLSNNTALLFCVIFFILVVSIFNIVGLMITQVTSSVTRNVLDSIRTVFIWIAMTFIFYLVDESLGEEWLVWSWLQLGGFCVLVSGVFTYNAVVKWSCFIYDK